MMLPLLMGTLSFVPMAACDYCCLRRRPGCGAPLFLFGCGLLIASTLRLLWVSSWDRLDGSSAVSMGLALVSLLLLVYSVFFAVKPRQEDRQSCPPEKQPLSCRGMYALCRHPGVLWLGAFYGFMALAFMSPLWLLAFLLFTAGDVLYVYCQDRWIFPYTIDRYREYQKATPFLIPTVSSAKEMIASFRQSERNDRP